MAGKKKSKRKTALAVQPSAAALERFKAAGIACGYDPAAMERLAARCEGMPLADRGRVRLDDQELLAAIDDRLALIFDYIDGYTLAKMSGRDLLVGVGILTDKRQLLRGEPTAITKFLDIRKLDDLAEMFHKEAARRAKLTPTPAESPANVVKAAENPGNGSLP